MYDNTFEAYRGSVRICVHTRLQLSHVIVPVEEFVVSRAVLHKAEWKYDFRMLFRIRILLDRLKNIVSLRLYHPLRSFVEFFCLFTPLFSRLSSRCLNLQAKPPCTAADLGIAFSEATFYTRCEQCLDCIP